MYIRIEFTENDIALRVRYWYLDDEVVEKYYGGYEAVCKHLQSFPGVQSIVRVPI